jgi:hypothetical protein
MITLSGAHSIKKTLLLQSKQTIEFNLFQNYRYLVGVTPKSFQIGDPTTIAESVDNFLTTEPDHS